MLERRGFRVLLAHDGIDGLAAFEGARDELTLAFLDLSMPRMGGDELVRAIREESATIPLVVMSGFSELELAGRFPGDAVSAFIQKPFRVEELDRSLRRALTPSR
jgi:CheY-like chemotaxis protein